MAAPYILARTFKEAHEFARDVLDLPRGHYRVVNSVGTVKAVRGVKLYLVPGWEQRFDRFAMKTALRYSKLDIIDGAEQRAEESDAPDESTTDEAAHLFLVSMIADGTRADEESLRDAANQEIEAALNEGWAPVEVGDADEPEKPRNRRRRRCKTCDTLHFKGEPCTPEDV